MKAAQPGAFVAFSVELLGERARAVARSVPAAELGCGVILLVRPLLIETALLAEALAVTFFIAASVAVWRHNRAGCGCFGAIDSNTPHSVTVLRALSLLVASTAFVVLTSRNDAAGSLFASMVVGGFVGLSATATSVLVGLMVNFHRDIRDLPPPLALGTNV